jgi:hypothetical protein
MAITDRPLFNNPELDYMMPDVSPPGVSVGPTGAGDPILDLLTPSTPELGGGITAGVPSFQTDVMNYDPVRWKTFLRQLIKEEPARFYEIQQGKNSLPLHMQGAVEEVANENRSVLGQAIADRERGLIKGPALGDVISSPIDTAAATGRIVKRRGSEVLDDIGALLERVGAGTTLPAEEGGEVIADIKAREAAEVTPTMALEETLTDIARGEVEGLPDAPDLLGQKTKDTIKNIAKYTTLPGQIQTGIDIVTEQTGDETSMLSGIRKMIQRSMPDNFYDFVGRGGVPVPSFGEPFLSPEGKEENKVELEKFPYGSGTAEILETQLDDIDEATLTPEQLEYRPYTPIEREDDTLKSKVAAEEFATNILDEDSRAQVESGANSGIIPAHFASMQNNPLVVDMAKDILRFINNGQEVTAQDAFYDLLEGIAAGLASEINPGVGIAKGAAAGNAKFQERLKEDKLLRIEAINAANDRLQDIADLDAAISASGAVDWSDEGKKKDFAEDWLDYGHQALASHKSAGVLDKLIQMVETGEVPLGYEGLLEEATARLKAFTGQRLGEGFGGPGAKWLKSKRLEFADELIRITQQNLQSILAESGRTISDRDRALVDRMVGDIEKWTAGFQPIGNLLNKLKLFRKDFAISRDEHIREWKTSESRNTRLRQRGQPFLDESSSTEDVRNLINQILQDIDMGVGGMPTYQRNAEGVPVIISVSP